MGAVLMHTLAPVTVDDELRGCLARHPKLRAGAALVAMDLIHYTLRSKVTRDQPCQFEIDLLSFANDPNARAKEK